MVKIELQYQVKHTEYGLGNYSKASWEAKTLIHDCNPNKTEQENLDDAFSKACELGADPYKNIRFKFIEG